MKCINYLRMSITEQCNLRCIYCGGGRGEFLSKEKVLKIAEVASSFGIKKMRISGGEPLLHKEIFDILKELQKFPFFDVSITTNGTLLPDCAGELSRFIKRVNVSLDTLDEEKYEFITGERLLHKVLSGIERAKEAGLSPIKINMVLLKGINDDEIPDMIRFAKSFTLTLRLIELMPTEDKKFWKKHFLSIKEIEKRVGEDAQIISSFSSPSCNECNKIRVTAKGALKTCLFSKDAIPILSFKKEEIEEAFLLCCKRKGDREGDIILSSMSCIGG